MNAAAALVDEPIRQVAQCGKPLLDAPLKQKGEL
jgi:hypothetical protein